MASVSISTTARIHAKQAARRARAKLWDRIAVISLWGVAAIIFVVFAFIIYSAAQGISGIRSLDFFTSGDPEIGIGPQLWNTFYMLFLSMIFMIPIGLGAAIYVVEYAQPGRFISILRFATETLSSTPSIIIGLLAALLFSSKVEIAFGIHGAGFGLSRVAGALALGILNLPWMLVTIEDALRAVPRELREASFALGATRLKTTLRAVIPAAIPGLITAVLIVSGRVIGESAALIYSAGEGGSPYNFLNFDLKHPGDTLAVHAYSLFADNPGANSARLRLATGFVLIMLVLGINLTARISGAVLNRRLSGKR